MGGAEKAEIVKQLQRKVNALQGLGKFSRTAGRAGVAPFESVFPGQAFPMGCIHEFSSDEPSEAAATHGFISALAAMFLPKDGICIWISTGTKLFAPGLKYFGLEPDHIVFVDMQRQQDVLWAIEEALRCDALAAVIGEVRQLGFAESRRLQLAVERSGVTGFIHRHKPLGDSNTACAAKWKINPLASKLADGLPGMGHTAWNIELLKVRNGRTGEWQLRWSGDALESAHEPEIREMSQLKAV